MQVTTFSPDYFTARTRFRQAAEQGRFELAAYGIRARGPAGELLSVDVARKGKWQPRRALVVSSGTHGVEGFFGSAVQLAALQGWLGARALPDDVAIVLIHALNPYGFAHVRRVNEDNVDLNRNFLLPGRPYAGAPDAYRSLDPLLNPRGPLRGVDAFWLRAGRRALRDGFSTLKNAVAQGQYEFPQGLFFGGKAPSETRTLLEAHAADWLGSPERVLHIDFHTGLGRFARYALCVDLPVHDPRVARLGREFGSRYVQGFDTSGVLYEIHGGLGRFLDAYFARTQYDCLLAEFGTVNTLRVLSAMRRENHAHHHARAGSPEQRRATRELYEVFCPSSTPWRETVVRRGLRILEQGLRVFA